MNQTTHWLLFFYCMFLGCHLSLSQQREKDTTGILRSETFTYAIKDGVKLYLDVYTKNEAISGTKPVFLYMHGGGFRKYSPREPDVVKLCKIAAAHGYVAIPISYRLTRKGISFGCDVSIDSKISTFRLAVEDLLDAVAFIKKHSETLNINPNKIFLGGSSAGAEAVLNAAYNRPLLSDRPSDPPTLFKGVMSFAGAILDSRYLTKNNAIPAVLYHGMDDDLVPYGSAPHHLCPSTSRGYLMLDGSRCIANRLKKLKVPYMLNSFKGAKHEIAGIPFAEVPMAFHFFDQILKGNQIQIENKF